MRWGDFSYEVLHEICHDLCAIGRVLCPAYFDLSTINDVLSLKFSPFAGRVRSKLPVLVRSSIGNDLSLGVVGIVIAALWILQGELDTLELGANAGRSIRIKSVGVIRHSIRGVHLAVLHAPVQRCADHGRRRCKDD
jgi:hypothetical protein